MAGPDRLDQAVETAEAAISAPADSRLVITFGGVSGADPQIEATHVGLGQVFAAAFLLDQWARELRADARAQAQAARIVPIGGPILDGPLARRIGRT